MQKIKLYLNEESDDFTTDPVEKEKDLDEEIDGEDDVDGENNKEIDESETEILQ